MLHLHTKDKKVNGERSAQEYEVQRVRNAFYERGQWLMKKVIGVAVFTVQRKYEYDPYYI